MSSDVSFYLDPSGGADILQNMMMPTIKQAGEAIAARAQAMASSQSSDPPTITVTTAVGTIKRGERAIATIRSVGHDAHSNYIGHMALAKSKDAGRV
jgi:hypothetical protein